MIASNLSHDGLKTAPDNPEKVQDGACASRWSEIALGSPEDGPKVVQEGPAGDPRWLVVVVGVPVLVWY